MSRRERTATIRCAEPGCREVAIYAYGSQREYGEIMSAQQRRPFKCTRHAYPEQVLRPDNPATEYVATALPSEGPAPGLYWTTPDGKRHSGFTFGDGYKAHASDFPEGTRLTVAARVELPP
jgi:hypothetical protein